jgi:hypothetical protein
MYLTCYWNLNSVKAGHGFRGCRVGVCPGVDVGVELVYCEGPAGVDVGDASEARVFVGGGGAGVCA